MEVRALTAYTKLQYSGEMGEDKERAEIRRIIEDV
jgi:hypothetical protein